LGNAIPFLSVKPKRGWYVFWLFFKIGQCSAILFERSRRELSIDVAEHRSMLKNCQNTHYPRFSFIPKTGKAFPETGSCFSQERTYPTSCILNQSDLNAREPNLLHFKWCIRVNTLPKRKCIPFFIILESFLRGMLVRDKN